MSVNTLRASRDKAVVVFTEFTRLYKQYPSALYCFFEGEDGKWVHLNECRYIKWKVDH